MFDKYPLIKTHLIDWLEELASTYCKSLMELELRKEAVNIFREAWQFPEERLREAAAEGLANFIDYQKFDSEIYHMAVALLREFAEDSRQDAPCKYAADHLKTYE